jgi:large repetitive protein
LGQVLSSSDSLGNTTSNSYDNFGNLTSTSDALSDTTTNTYGDGGLVTSEDPIGTLATNIYDPQTLNLIASAILDSSTVILSSNTFTFDADNNRLTSTVWRRTNAVWTAATTANFYDGQNRLTETINPDGGTMSSITWDSRLALWIRQVC